MSLETDFTAECARILREMLPALSGTQLAPRADNLCFLASNVLAKLDAERENLARGSVEAEAWAKAELGLAREPCAYYAACVRGNGHVGPCRTEHKDEPEPPLPPKDWADAWRDLAELAAEVLGVPGGEARIEPTNLLPDLPEPKDSGRDTEPPPPGDLVFRVADWPAPANGALVHGVKDWLPLLDAPLPDGACPGDVLFVANEAQRLLHPAAHRPDCEDLYADGMCCAGEDEP